MHRLQSTQARFAAVLIAAAVVAVALVAASLLSGGNSASKSGTTTTSPQATGANEPSLFRGIPQDGAELGSPTAPLTLVEYADVQCPYCAHWAIDALPTVVAKYVKTGKLRIVFNGMSFVGPDSRTGLETAIAAGRSNHLWEVLHGLYAAQGTENSGWVTDDLVKEIAATVPGLDGSKLIEARSSAWVQTELRRVVDAAQAAGVNSTPTFQLGKTGGPLEFVELKSLKADGITPAIDTALAAAT